MRVGDISNLLSSSKKYIKKIGDFIRGSSRNVAIFGALLIIIIIANYWVAGNLLGGQDLFVNWNASRNLFIEQIDPYSNDSLALASQISKTYLILPANTDFHFIKPIFILFIYSPFSLISNFVVVRTFWLILSELFLYLSSKSIMRILKWPNVQNHGKFIVFSFAYFFSIITLLQGSDHLFIFMLLLITYESIQDHKYFKAGICFSFLTINPQIMFLLIVFQLFLLIIRKAWSGIIWFIISLGILFTAGLLVLPNWIVNYLREIFANASASGMILPGIAINHWIKNSIPDNLWNFMAIGAIGLLVYEMLIKRIAFRLPIWMFGLTIAFTPLIIIQPNLAVMCFLLFPLGLIMKSWIERNKELGINFSRINFLIFTFFLMVFSFLTRPLSNQVEFSISLYFLPMIFVLINLYWIKGWMTNQIEII